MRALLPLILISAVLVSACVSTEDANKAGVGIFSTEKSTEDILVKAELSNTQVKSGLNTSIKFTVTNKQPFDLKNFNLNIYDLCDFTCDKPALWEEDVIRINRTKEYRLNCKSPEIETERTCNIKFKPSYSGEMSQSHDVVVITESEYAVGRTSVSLTSTSTASPLKISATWSDSQPFVEKDKVYLYLDYEYSGDGIIEKLAGKTTGSEGDVSFIVPKNLLIDLDNCIDFEQVGEKFVLKKDLFFISAKAKRSTCTFTTKASQPIDSGKLFINATFNYQLDGSIPVTIQPRKNI